MHEASVSSAKTGQSVGSCLEPTLECSYPMSRNGYMQAALLHVVGQDLQA